MLILQTCSIRVNILFVIIVNDSDTNSPIAYAYRGKLVLKSPPPLLHLNCFVIVCEHTQMSWFLEITAWQILETVCLHL